MVGTAPAPRLLTLVGFAGLVALAAMMLLPAASAGDAVWAAVTNDGEIATSDDGANWTRHTGIHNRALLGVDYGDGVWVAVGGLCHITRSTDGGATWNQVPIPASAAGCKGALLDVHTDGNGLWVAVGSTGTSDGDIFYSTDNGASWSFTTGAAANYPGRLRTVAVNETGFWVALGDGAGVWSGDGINWNAMSNDPWNSNDYSGWWWDASTSTNLFEVDHGDGIWCAVGTYGRFFRSTDGQSWTPEDEALKGDHSWVNGLAFGDGTFAMGTSSGWWPRAPEATSSTCSGPSSSWSAWGGNGLTRIYAIANRQAGCAGLDWISAGIPGNSFYTRTTGQWSPDSWPLPSGSLVRGVAGRDTGAHAASNSTIGAAPLQVIADDSDTATVTVTLVDAAGDPVPCGGSVVRISTDFGTLVGPAASGASVVAKDHGDGTYTATVRSLNPGVANLSATIDGAPLNDTAEVTFLPEPPHAQNTTIEASPTTREADGAQASTVTVTLYDSHDRRVTSGGHAVALQTSVGTLAPLVDHGDGTYTAQLMSTDRGVAKVTGTLANVPIADQAEVTFIAASAVSATIDADPPRRVAGGDGATVTVTLHDRLGRQVLRGGDTVTIHTTLGDLGTLQDHRDGTYTAALTSATAGDATVTGTLNGVAIQDDAVVSFFEGGDPPVPWFTYTREGQEVRLDPTPSRHGGTGIFRATWLLGDGTSQEVTCGPVCPLDLSAAVFSHPYPDTGSYQVTLRLLGMDGREAEVSRDIVVESGAGGGVSAAAYGEADATSQPVADAGEAQAVREATAVTLDGTGSSGDRSLQHAWRQVKGPSVDLLDARSASPRFVAPDVADADSPVELRFELTVSDATGRSSTDRMGVWVYARQLPPEFLVQAPERVQEAAAVSLEAHAVRDGAAEPDAGTVRFAWSQVSGPPVALSSTTGSAVTFEAPEVDGPVPVRIQVRATNGIDWSPPQVVAVVVEDVRAAPVADFEVFYPEGEGPLRFLAGAEGESLRYSWDFGDGRTSDDRHPSHSYASDGTYTVTLEVTDAADRTAAANRTVSVQQDGAESLQRLDAAADEPGPGRGSGWWWVAVGGLALLAAGAAGRLVLRRR